jgi:hypothetical protein
LPVGLSDQAVKLIDVPTFAVGRAPTISRCPR